MALKNEGIEVRYTGLEGRGVFATRDFKKGELIEACPVVPIIVYEEEDGETYDWPDNNLKHYTYEWGDGSAIVLGYGSLYNHSNEPNVDYDALEASSIMRFIAERDIKKDEQLFIAYDDPEEYEVTFEDGGYSKKPLKTEESP